LCSNIVIYYLIRILSIGLTPQQFCACPKPGAGFQTSCFFCFVFSKLRLEGIACFNDISGIVDHQLLNFLFIISDLIIID
jgi:hypothetical protein